MNVRALIGSATAAAFLFVLGAAVPATAGKGGGGPKGGGGKKGGAAMAGTHTHAGGGGTKGPKATGPKGGGATHGGGAQATGPKGGGATHGGGAKATAPKGGGNTAHGGGAQAAPGQAKKGGSTTAPATGSGAPAADTVTTTPGGNLSKAQQQLQANAKLRDKLQQRLPAGTDVITAASGFKSLGQFVAAANVSNNLGLDFLALKNLMTVDGLSLGQAIQRLKRLEPASAQAIADRAIVEANTLTGSAASAVVTVPPEQGSGTSSGTISGSAAGSTTTVAPAPPLADTVPGGTSSGSSAGTPSSGSGSGTGSGSTASGTTTTTTTKTTKTRKKGH